MPNAPRLKRQRSGKAGEVRLLWLAVLIAFFTASLSAAPGSPDLTAMLLPGQATPERLASLKADGYTGIVLMLNPTQTTELSASANRIKQEGLAVDYWIEVARNPALADQHPEWMASIQTHPEWRRLFPDFSGVKSNEVVKVYPWVPVLYRETFDVHVQIVKSLLKDQPMPRRLFLNGLQGAPSACGCGHPLCRWTTDYGPITTATRLPDQAAAQFVSAVKQLAQEAEVVPVWATECEAEDREDLCGGVGCYGGACWREWTAQLMPLAEAAPAVGVLATYKMLQRDLPVYGKPAGWVARALKFFKDMPARYDQKGVASNRLLAVVQGWDVSPAQLSAQINQARQAEAKGVVVALAPIKQGWQPVIYHR